MASKVFAIGETVWAHTGSEHSFEKGVVERLDGHKNTITIKIGKNSVDIKESDVHKTNADKQDGLPDNTYLRELNEATLLHNVRTRYNDKRDDGGCYSCTGHILIAVNPFRSLNIYEESNVRTRRIGHFVSCCATTLLHAPPAAPPPCACEQCRTDGGNDTPRAAPSAAALTRSSLAPVCCACPAHSPDPARACSTSAT
jgi:hypothetical protein